MDKSTLVVHNRIEDTISFGETRQGEEEQQQFWCGIVKVRELPHDCTQEDYSAWWPRIPEKERERYTAYESHNILTLGGFNQLLTYIGSSTSTTLGFAQYFAVGTFPVITVQSGDTSVAGEIFRAVPSSQTIVGNQLTLSTFFGPSQGNGILTNAGLFGVSASAVANSGIMMTHTLYRYVKTSIPISNDYLILLQ